jgi:hypothetical protein
MDPLYWQSLKIGLLTDSNQEKRKLTTLIAATTIIFLVFITTLNLFFSLFRQKNPDKPAVLGLTDVAVTPIITPKPTLTPAPTNLPAITVFEATLSAKPIMETNKGLYLADVLTDALKLPLIAGKPYPIKKILYDTTKVASAGALQAFPFNHHYYIVLSGPFIVSESASSAYVSVKTKPISPNMLPYFTDSTFCQKDTDCVVRDSLCQQNAFNRYEVFMDNYSCKPLVPPVDEQPIYSELYGCYLGVKASSPTCNQNHCQLREETKCL